VTPIHLTRRDALAALGAMGLAGLARAQAPAASAAYPSKLIKLVCAHAAGGAGDLLSRIVGDRMAGALEQPIIVENRPGASTMLAAEYVAAAPPDGYTVLMATVTTLSINPSLHTRLKYDPVKDFTPLSIVASTPFFLGVGNNVPAKSVADVIALAKAKPGALNYGSSGMGTSSHLAGELFNQMAGTKMVHVPYNATSTRNNDLASGVIQIVFGNDLQTLAKAGRLRIVGVTSAQRLSGYPDIPTVAEAGPLPGYEASVWYGIVGPAGLPAPIAARLQQAIAASVAGQDVQSRIMTAVGGDAVGSTSDQFRQTIASDLTKWNKVIKLAGIKPED
jgi:tripartite-type tricarboxylate transporter receptor subunit TctC